MQSPDSQSDAACAVVIGTGQVRHAVRMPGAGSVQGRQGEWPAQVAATTPAWVLLWAAASPMPLHEVVPLISICTKVAADFEALLLALAGMYLLQ